jgi:hypothetical protein
VSAEFREHNTWRLTWAGLETGLFAWKELLGFCASVLSSSERVPHHPGRRDSEGPEPAEIAIVGMAGHDSSFRFIVPDSSVGAAGNTVVHETPSRTCIARP